MKLVLLLLMMCPVPALAADPQPKSDPAAPDGWSFKVYDADAQPGDRIPYRLAWTNTSRHDVRVPEDLFTSVLPSSTFRFRMVESKTLSGRGVEAVTRADKVKWLTLGPGEALQQLGDITDFFPVCEDGGCPEGSYDLVLEPVMRNWDVLAEDQRDPKPQTWKWHLDLGSRTTVVVPVTGGPGLEAKLVKVGAPKKDGTLAMKVKVTNRMKVPIYVPRDMIAVNWEIRSTFRDSPHPAVARTGTGIGGQGAWRVKDAVLLKPGQSHVWNAETMVDPEALTVSVIGYVETIYPFNPELRVMPSRFYFEGTIVTPELRVR